MTLLLFSCSARAPVADPAPADRPELLDRLLNQSLGLDLRRWEVAASAEDVAAALAAHADGEAVGPAAAEALARNGMSLVRVRLDRLGSLRRALAPVVVDVTAWHGQVFTWRPLHAVAVGPGAAAVALDGHVVRLDPGPLQLLARCWVVPMEDGPLLDLQLVPRLQRPAAGSASLTTARPGSGRLLPTLAVEMSMRAGWACVLSAAAPAGAGDGGDDATRASDGGNGPAAEAPLTVGEVLFARDAPPPKVRVLLVFVPQLGPVP